MGKWSEFMNMFKDIVEDTDVSNRLGISSGLKNGTSLVTKPSSPGICPKMVYGHENGLKSTHKCNANMPCYGGKK